MSDHARQVIVSLVPVGKRVARDEQWFAIVVAAGLVRASALSTAEREALRPRLLPADWKWSTPRDPVPAKRAPRVAAWVRRAGATGTASWTAIASRGEVPALRTPELAAGMLAHVAGWLDARHAPELQLDLPPPALEVPGTRPPPLGYQLAHLTTYPGSLAQDLAITAYVRFVFPADLAATDLELIAVPLIVDPDGRKRVPATWTEASWSWTYSRDAGALATEARVEPLRLARTEPPHVPQDRTEPGPDPDTGWIYVQAEHEAWTETVAHGAAALVDLARRVAEALPRVDHAPDDATLREVVRVALRYHAGAAPRAVLDALLAAAGAPPVPHDTPEPATAYVIERATGASTAAELVELAPGDDYLWWLWQAMRPPVVDETSRRIQPTLRDGRAAGVLAPGAERRAAATRLVASIIALTRPRVVDGQPVAALTAFAAAKRVGADWLATAATALRTAVPAAATALGEWVAKLVPEYLDQLWATLDGAPEPARATVHKPGGIGVRLGIVDLAQGPADPWRDLAGFALLVQRIRSGVESTWKVVNGANVVTREIAGRTAVDGPALYDTPAVVPAKLPLRDGVRHPFVAYEHRSLIAHSPLDDARGATTALDDNPVQAHIAYRAPLAGPEFAHLLLPQLRYGDAYRLAAATIDLGGGTADELSTPGAPWVWTAPRGAPRYATPPITYLREVPVGHVRIARTRPTGEPDVVPEIAPIAREIPPPPGHEADPASVPLVVARWDRGKRSDAPVCAMAVQPPAVDVDVVERWLGVEATKARRRDELNAGRALQWDDPAVASLWIGIRTFPLLASGADRTWSEPVGLRIALAAGANIRCLFVPGAASSVLADGTIQLAVPPEEWEDDRALPRVFAVEISPWLPSTAAALFANHVLPRGRAVDDGVALPGYVMMVERASRRMPTELELAGLFDAQPVSPTGREVTLTLGALNALPPELANIVRAEVLRHTWTWAGRPRPRLVAWPRECIPVPRNEPHRRWEETAFIDLEPWRGELPVQVLRMPVARFVGGRELLRDRWTDVASSHYIRYSVAVDSRYAALWPPDNSTHRVFAREDGRPAWRSVWLPARRPATTRPPVVRAILPLTRAAGVATAGWPPGVMVVLDEPAFRDHGISEGIVAEIVTAEDWRDGVATRVLEYGRDPVISAVPAGLPAVAKMVPLHGPYGLTNDDTSAIEPLFGASCYVLPPPFPGSGAWDFARVRFRRVVEDVEDVEHASPAASDDEWTRTYWIQLLAPSNELAPAAPELAPPRTLRGLGAAAAGFWTYAIVTAQIQSFQGAIGDEVYVDAVRIANGEAALRHDAPTPELLVRVCEVQPTQPFAPPPPEDLWAALFPEEPAADALLRITRISRPVPVRRR